MLKSVFDLFLAAPCALCDRPQLSLGLCQDCHQQLRHCRWPSPRANAAVKLPVVSWGEYGGLLKRAIAKLKYEGQTQLAEPLGLALAEAWLHHQAAAQQAAAQQAAARQAPAQQRPLLSQRSRSILSPAPRFVPRPAPRLVPRPVVVPIPLHSAKQQQRGFNQAELVAAAFCRRLRLPLHRAGLKRVRLTTPQFQLTPAERRDNQADAFVWESEKLGWRDRPLPSPILLLDDIYTTGATIASARAAIEAAGLTVCGCVAIAQAGAPSPGPSSGSRLGPSPAGSSQEREVRPHQFDPINQLGQRIQGSRR